MAVVDRVEAAAEESETEEGRVFLGHRVAVAYRYLLLLSGIC
ncbi:protein of unknown function [Methylacidimicrobium sp. AP8]|nr:protein of unknown function [Methylacidimicrobium sp. AP8]